MFQTEYCHAVSSEDVILRRAEGTPRDRTPVRITTAVEKTVHVACMPCIPFCLTGTARSRSVPRAGFAAAQDDNGFKMTALHAALYCTEITVTDFGSSFKVSFPP